MTIAITVELKEDWGLNTPCVEVMARPIRGARLGYPGEGNDYEVACLTPTNPRASVTITEDRDLYFRVTKDSDRRMRRK